MSDDRTDTDQDAEGEPRCYNCTRRPGTGGRWCRPCMDNNRVGTVRWRIKQLAAGNCVGCGQRNPGDGLRTRCPSCRAKDAARWRAKQQARASAGVADASTIAPG